MTSLERLSERKGLPNGGNPTWELSPNAPGVIAASVELARRLPTNAAHPKSKSHSVGSTLQYDEVDRRLMDTFPASDAVGRY